ncbi:MAG: DUF6110 family protein [Lachnospiraceae bacterium]|nr:DUF6110 family protein [Lachnospiraceae bacterium]
MFDFKIARWVACGVVLGTAGVKVLASKDAKKVYTHLTAAAFRGKDCVMETVTNIKENWEDISYDAKEINEERYEKEAEAEIEDAKRILEEADMIEKEKEESASAEV